MSQTTITRPGDWASWPADLKADLDADDASNEVGDRLVYENDRYKVWHIHLPAGERLPFHKHVRPYFWTVLSTGKSRSYYHDGTVVEAVYEIGGTTDFPDLSEENYFIHNLENIGDTTLIFTTVEFLK